MKTKLLLSLLIVMLLMGFRATRLLAQTPSWAWSTDSATRIAAGGMCSDEVGNVYVANDFGSDFLAKYNNNGQKLWSKSATGSQDSPPAVQTYSSFITLDLLGNIYVSGFFTSATLVIETTALTRISTVDMFIAKFNDAGTLLWAKSEATGNVGNTGFKVAADPQGNAVVVGSYSAATVTIGSTAFTNPCTAGGGCPSMLVIKYDGANGNVLWAKSSFSGIGTTYCYSVAIDASSNIYVGGDFLNDRNGIVKYTSAGDTMWTQEQGGWYLTLDKQGNLFSGYDKDISTAVVKKFNSANGTQVWADTAIGNTNNKGIRLVADTSGNLYYVGTFRSTSITFGTITLTYNGSGSDDDIFIVKYSNNGVPVWGKAIGGTGFDAVSGTTVDVAGNVFIGGFFISPTLTFDAITLTNTGQVAGIANIYFAKLGNNTVIGTGISESEVYTPGFKLFPNPAKERIHIGLSDEWNSTADIFNVTGQLLISTNLNSGVTDISTEELPCGLYIIKIKNEKGISVKKFVRE